MKKLLDKSVSLRSLLLVALLVLVAVTSVAATPTNVTATLSPDITIKHNGVKQTMKDASGQTVYPLLYKGTTYMPIRAVADLVKVAVDWDGTTRTVLLGEKNAAKLVDNCDKVTGLFGEIYAEKMLSNLEFSSADTTRSFTSAIRINDVNSADKSGVFLLKSSFSTLNTTFYLYTADGSGSSNWTLRIYDYDKDLLLAEKIVKACQFVDVTDIQLAGVKNLKFEAVGPAGGKGIAYFLDPTIK